ncbi:MAG: DUF2142 domain-containing protein [Lachnospiraceae bacterium]|nr:DUF2142 domain-containing protein [Lachnospiraceae bacterium]
MLKTVKNSKQMYVKTALSLMAVELLMFMSVRWIIGQRTEYEWLSKYMVGFLSYLIGCGGTVLLVFFIMAVRKRLRHEHLFLVLYFALGMAYMVVSPLSSVPDETEHMLRAYGITIGDFVPPVNDNGEGGSYVPANLTYQWDRSGSRLEYMVNNIRMEASDDKTFAVYSNTAFYSPLTYVPQAVGMFVTRLVCNRPYVIAYAGRMCELIASGILMFYAIKLMPFGKNILLVLSLLPMNMYECASLSGDGMAYAVTLLVIAYCLWLRYEKSNTMNRREIVYLYLLLALVASCKIVYAPFVLMAFIIPVDRFGDRKRYLVHLICAGVMIFVLAVGWPIGIGSRYLLEFTEGVSASKQTVYVLTRPWDFLQIMINTLMQEGEWLFKTYFAASLSYFSVGCNIVMVFISFGSLVFVCIMERIYSPEDERNIKWWKRPTVIIGLATLASIVFTFLSLYIEWTPYRASAVTGLQGRYFIPLTFQMAYLIKRKYERDSSEGITSDIGNGIMPISVISMCMANLMVVVTLLVHFC